MNANRINIKQNLISLSVFLFIALLSAVLIMTAINMLEIPKPEASGKGDQTSSPKNTDKSAGNNSSNRADNNIDNNGKTPDISEYWDRGKEWRERAKQQLEERKSAGNKLRDGYAYGSQPGSFAPRGGNGAFTPHMPQDMPNVDISGNQEFPDMPFGMKEPDGNTMAMGDGKRPHVPVFEILGKPNYSFLKVMTMENYQGNHWVMAKEKPEVKLMLGVERTKGFVRNSVKIKPIEPSEGYLPVLSGEFDLKYTHSVLEYQKSGSYFSEVRIDDYYEMAYKTPPGELELINADVDDSYNYDVIIPELMDEIIDRVIEGSSSDYEAIKNVEKFLAENYTLNNNITKSYGEQDAIIAFLFGEQKQGNTMDFMSAYTYILRSEGIPCRLALGYKIDKEQPYQIVYLDQTYIYPEIKFKDYGWVPMEIMDKVFGFNQSYEPYISTVTEISSMDA